MHSLYKFVHICKSNFLVIEIVIFPVNNVSFMLELDFLNAIAFEPLSLLIEFRSNLVFSLLRLRLASVIKLEYRLFRVNNLLNRITCLLVHIEFKLLRVPGKLSLEVTNIPGTAKVPGSNLRRILFSNGNFSV